MMLNVNLWSTLFLGAGKEPPAQTTATAPETAPGLPVGRDLVSSSKKGPRTLFAKNFVLVWGFFWLFVCKVGVLSAALLTPTRGQRFTQSGAAPTRVHPGTRLPAQALQTAGVQLSTAIRE